MADRFELRTTAAPTPLANVRMRARYPGSEGDSRDLHAKVVGVESGDGSHLVSVHLTSVDEADRRAIEALLDPGKEAPHANRE
jgi:hypothetical protein